MKTSKNKCKMNDYAVLFQLKFQVQSLIKRRQKEKKKSAVDECLFDEFDDNFE